MGQENLVGESGNEGKLEQELLLGIKICAHIGRHGFEGGLGEIEFFKGERVRVMDVFRRVLDSLHVISEDICQGNTASQAEICLCVGWIVVVPDSIGDRFWKAPAIEQAPSSGGVVDFEEIPFRTKKGQVLFGGSAECGRGSFRHGACENEFADVMEQCGGEGEIEIDAGVESERLAGEGGS